MADYYTWDDYKNKQTSVMSRNFFNSNPLLSEMIYGNTGLFTGQCAAPVTEYNYNNLTNNQIPIANTKQRIAPIEPTETIDMSSQIPKPVPHSDYIFDLPAMNTMDTKFKSGEYAGMSLNELQKLQSYRERTKAIQDQTSANQASNWASFGLDTVGQISKIAGTWANYELQRKHLSKQNALIDTQTQDLKEQMERRREEYARLKRVRNKTTTAMNKGATITRSVL